MSESPFDLTTLREFREELMTDVLRVTRDVEGSTDDTWDPVTNKTTPPADDQSLVYEGPGGVSYPALTSDEVAVEGREVLQSPAVVKLPLSAPQAARSDIVECLSSDTNPTLVGKRWRVVRPTSGTLSVSQRLLCEGGW